MMMRKEGRKGGREGGEREGGKREGGGREGRHWEIESWYQYRESPSLPPSLFLH